MSTVSFPEDFWTQLYPAISSVYRQEPMKPKEYMKHYSYIYNYCAYFKSRARLHGRPDTVPSACETEWNVGQMNPDDSTRTIGVELYRRLRTFFNSHLAALCASCADLKNDSLLKYFTREWQNYRFSSQVLDGFCSYVNRQWVSRERENGKKNVLTVYGLALSFWLETFFQPIQAQVISACLRLIKMEREGEYINSLLIRGVVDCLVELGEVLPSSEGENIRSIYKHYFEFPFLEDTEAFYKAESHEFLSRNSVTEYMVKIEERLAEEAKRVQTYLHESTNSALEACVEHILITNYLDVFYVECGHLLNEHKITDLKRMYTLLCKFAQPVQTLRSIFEEHVYKDGMQSIEKLTNAANSPETYVQCILELHSRYTSLIESSFNGSSGFVTSLDKAFGRFVNQNSVTQEAGNSAKSPELLARYCDLLLRKSIKNSDDLELDETLSRVMTVFNYLDDKDVFQKFYGKMLAKRLVGQISFADDAELLMISKLKQCCGFEYTSKLQRMFQDIGINKDTNEKFRKSPFYHGMNDSVDFYATVLSSGAWPFTKMSEFTLPIELEKMCATFSEFYIKHHSGRKLTWLFNLSKCELITNCFKRRYTLQASTFQTGILLLYNKQNEYTLSEIEEATQLRDDILKQIVGILLKSRLLTINGEESECDEKNLTPDTKLTVYENYKNKKLRVNINLPLRFEAKLDVEQTHKSVDEDRTMLIQAAIVRIMKARKSLAHNLLITEVLTMLSTRFKAKVSDIKKSIDVLIEKEYLTREEGRNDVYRYLA